MKLSKHLGAILALNLSLAPSVLASATCSQLSGSIYTGSNGKSFDILCDTSTVNGNIFAYYSDGDEFQDCVDRCDAVSICVVALYLAGSGDCALINSYQGTRSFNGNDVAVKRAATTETTSAAESVSSSDAASTSIEISSIEATSTVASTTEPSSTDASSTEVLSTDIEDSSTETSSTEATSTVASTTETSSATEALTTELSSTGSFSTEVPSTKVEDSSTDTSSNGAESTGALSTETSSIEAVSTSTEVMSESTSTSEAFTIVTTTTNSHYTSTAGVETSTDDCDDETSTIETSAAEVTSTVTASEILSTTLSTDSLGAPTTTLQTGELSTSAFSETSAFTSLASSLTTTENHNSVSTSLSNSVTDETPSTLSPFLSTTTTEIHATYTQVTFSSWSSLETTKHGSKTRSVSGITTMTTESASRLTTPYPTSDCVWTVYLTMVEYVTCSTGVIPETAITTRYVTATNHGESYRPPVVVLPSGCIGGYQVDVSGHSYPVALPTKGPYDNSTYQGYSQPSARPTQGSSGNSHPVYDNNNPHVPAPTVESNGDSRPEYIDGHPSVPESTQGSHAEYDEDTSSQQSTAGYGSPEPNKNRPQKTEGLAPTTSISAYESDVPVNLPVSSAIHHGQTGISSTFAIMSTATKDMYRPSASLSTPEEAPSTPVIASGASGHQGIVWAVIAVAFIALGI